MRLVDADTPERLATARELFVEYAAWLGVDLCFQGFERELATLPGQYAQPRGRLYLALDDDRTAGCVALRPFVDPGICEMKRLYVRPAWRGKGLGRLLAARVCDDARSMGYAWMVLDTLPSMRSAIALYESLGFVRRSRYYETPIAQTVFMELRL